jgi:hypothetical protein
MRMGSVREPDLARVISQVVQRVVGQQQPDAPLVGGGAGLHHGGAARIPSPR